MPPWQQGGARKHAQLAPKKHVNGVSQVTHLPGHQWLSLVPRPFVKYKRKAPQTTRSCGYHMTDVIIGRPYLINEVT